MPDFPLYPHSRQLPSPSPAVLRRRRRPKFLINPNKVTNKQYKRIWDWAHTVMAKHEHLLKPDVPNRKVVAWSGMEAEEIDISHFFPFQKNLNWIIYRDGLCWSIMIRHGKAMLAKLSFTKI